MNLRDWFENGPMRCMTKDAANEWLEHEIKSLGQRFAMSADEARKYIITNLGFATGFYPMEVAKKAYEFWGAAHPYFGTPEERAKLTAIDFIQISAAMSQIANGDVEAEG